MHEALEGNEIPLQELTTAKANVVIISPTGASNQARGAALCMISMILVSLENVTKYAHVVE